MRFGRGAISIALFISGWIAGAAQAGTAIRSSGVSNFDCHQFIAARYPSKLGAYTREHGTRNTHSVPASSPRSDLDPAALQRFLETINPRLDRRRYGSIAELYREWGDRLGVRWDYAFFQMLHETSYLRFTGGVKPEDRNLAGIGATVTGEDGSEFPDGRHSMGPGHEEIEPGIIAHLQHLQGYGLLDIDPTDFVRERAEISLSRHCRRSSTLCGCFDVTHSYTACTRSWVMLQVCLQDEPGTWEALSQHYAADGSYFAKVFDKQRAFEAFQACDGYANEALQHAADNSSRKCGYPSSERRWSTSWRDHYEFCKGASGAERRVEAAGRFAAIQSCAKPARPTRPSDILAAAASECRDDRKWIDARPREKRHDVSISSFYGSAAYFRSPSGVYCFAKGGGHFYVHAGNAYQRYELKAGKYVRGHEIVITETDTSKRGRIIRHGRSRAPGEKELSNSRFTVVHYDGVAEP